MITITGTPEEFIALKQLLHRAVLHSGLEAADAAVYWMHKIVEAEQQHVARKGNGAAREQIEAKAS